MKKIEVVAAIIIDEDKVLATQRASGIFEGLYEFPGGKIEFGESKEEALKREIREELAIEIKIEEFFDVVNYEYDDFQLEMYCFICSINNYNYILKEHSDARWLKADELYSIQWLEADLLIIEKLENKLKSLKV
jgi:8-oxo-dGTP diphosphatase